MKKMSKKEWEDKKAKWEERRQKANKIIAKRELTLKTGFGDYIMGTFDANLNVACHPKGANPTIYNRRTFCLHGGHVEKVIAGNIIID